MSETTGATIRIGDKTLPASDGFGATVVFKDQAGKPATPVEHVRAAIKQCGELSQRVAKSAEKPKP